MTAPAPQSVRPRVQIVTTEGARFTLENGAWLARDPGASLPRAGSVLQVQTILAHPMETGNRKDAAGRTVPRNIVTGFRASVGGRSVFEADLSPGVSANPYLAFFIRLDAAATLELVWTGDHGFELAETVPLVTA